MKLEFIILIYSMINNLVISFIKIVGGIIFGLSSLFADGMHTFSDFITDIVCIVGAKISKKKPTKHHPFGFGRVEYLANLFVGVILLLLSIFIIASSFSKGNEIPSLKILWLLLICFIFKLIAIIVMHNVGNKINSQVLVTSVKESKADLYSSVLVAFVTILLQFSDKFEILKLSDLIASILMGLLVLSTALEVIVDNSLSLIGEVDDNPKIINKIKEYLSSIKGIKDYEISLIMYGSYYKLQLSLELDSKLSLRKITNLEKKIKKELLRKKELKVKYITIYVTNNLN